MVDSNVDLKTIGLMAFLGLPYTLKFLWAPILDRFPLGLYRRPGDRRLGWVLLTQWLLAGLCLAIAWVGTEQLNLLVLCCFLCNLVSATQDMSLDAYRRELVTEQQLGEATGLFVNGYLSAFRFIAGALAIYLSTLMPWPQVYLSMGALMLMLSGATLLAPAPPALTSSAIIPSNLKQAFVGPFKEFFKRPQALMLLSFIVLYKLGDNLASGMTLPFILGQGVSKESFVAASKLLGFFALMAGSLLGGFWQQRLGMRRALLYFGALQAISTLGFALLQWDQSFALLSGIIAIENFTTGLGTTVFSAYLFSATHQSFSASQYALFTSLMRIPSILLAGQSGVLAQSLGWNAFFGLCTLLAIPGLWLAHQLTLIKTPPTTRVRKIALNIFYGIMLMAISTGLVKGLWDLLQLLIKL